MSIAGGLARAVARIRRVNGTALQIFSANQRRWQTPALADEEVAAFVAAVREWGDYPVAVHTSYLINLAASRDEIAEKSVHALVAELERTARLGIPFLVMHPGAHTGAGVEAGIQRLAANLDRVLAARPRDERVTILLETTAGQGTSLGGDFRQLARIIELTNHPERFGVCFDTCHVFAAGWDIRTPKGYEATMAAFDRIIGLDRLLFFHLNDSQGACGSRRDRHAHIGEGAIGLQGFRLLVNDPRFAEHPMVLETPKDEELAEDHRNLAILRNLAADTSPLQNGLCAAQGRAAEFRRL